jgi:hypothetical protein
VSGLTKSQKAALKWLQDRGGDGCFDKSGVAFAQGETAPFTRHTWNGLAAAGLLTFYGGRRDGGRGYGRLKLEIEAPQ